MTTRLSLFCNRIIEAGWLAALVVVPLYFNPFSSRVFEPDKIALLRSIAVIMGWAWVIKAGETWRMRGKWKRGAEQAADPPPRSPGHRLALNPIVWSVVLLLACYVLATAFSILPHISLWGYFGRLQGLYTTGAYLVFFFSVLALLRAHEQAQRLITTVILVSIPMALYGILQHFGGDPLNWDRPVAERVQATMGNPVFLAAALSMAVPLTLYRLAETGRDRRAFLRLGGYLLVLGLQGACLLFTQSRGPVLGLAVGLLFGGLIWTLTQHRWRWAKSIIGLSIALASTLTIINLPGTPPAFVQEVPLLSRLTRIADVEGSSEGRVLIWDGAIDLITADPMRMVIGYGPETIRFAYYPYYSSDIGRTHGWRAFPDRMHNETYDVLVTTGLVGFLIYLLLFTGLVYFSLMWTGVLPSSRHRQGFLVLWFIGSTGGILGLRFFTQTWAYSGVGLLLGMLGGLFLYLAGYAFTTPRREHRAGDSSPRAGGLLIIVLLAGILAHFVEINVGFAVSSTRLSFWIYTAFLVVLGVYGGRSLGFSIVSSSSDAKSLAVGRKTGDKVSEKSAGKARSDPKSSTARRFPMAVLPVTSLGVGLMLMTLAYSLFADGWPSENGLLIGGLFVATWMLAGLILVLVDQPAHGGPARLRKLAMYAVLSLLPLVLFLTIKLVDVGGENLHLLFYYVLVFLVLLIGGVLMYRGGDVSWSKPTFMGVVLAFVGLFVAGLLVYKTNVLEIQANMYHRAAQTAFQQRRYDQAMIEYQRALDLDPDQGLYQLEYAQLLATKAHYRSEDASEREQLFQAAERILKDAAVRNPYEQYHHAALADVYRLWARKTTEAQLRTARYEQALDAFSEAMHINAENVLILRTWAELYAEMGDRGRALDMYRRVLARDSTEASVYMRIGVLYRAGEEWEDAAEMFEGALRHSRRPLPGAHQALVGVYQRLGRLEEAVRAGEQAVRLNPGVPANHVALIRLYQRLGRCPEALDRVRAALMRWPDDSGLKAHEAEIRQRCAEQPDSE
ncbi:MAG: O-antigen ligase family protein [Rhodothermales bacterium]